MISVLRCKFLKIYEIEKKDKTKFYILSVLDENERNIKVINFYISNQDALNFQQVEYLSNMTISLDIWFTNENNLKYKINKIVVEK